MTERRTDGGWEHEYAAETCPKCGREFCWACCGGTNVHHGGKYEQNYTLCPACGHDICVEVT